MSLITKRESEESSVTQAEAQKFIAEEQPMKQEEETPQQDGDDADDLLDDMWSIFMASVVSYFQFFL